MAKADLLDPELPAHVLRWVKSVFYECNRRISEKIANNPNAPEQSLDLTWIEHLSRYSSPVALGSSWVAKIQAHYLGGLRHFMRWEIADIGVLVFIRKSGRIQRSKVALLQSKRLYPSNKRVIEEHQIDYEIGFARLADPEDLARSIALETEFEFNEDCEYGALTSGSDQAKAIDQYMRKEKLAVYYQLYNPWAIPFTQRVPVAGYEAADGEPTLGTRVIPVTEVHGILRSLRKGSSPTLRSLAAAAGNPHVYGWALEHFVAELLMKCQEGSVFESINDTRIQNLFIRRTGPIAAAIAITIEGP